MKVKKIISYIIDIFLVGLIFLLLYVQISMNMSKGGNYGVPVVFGKSFLYVATESMNDPDNPDCLKAGTGIIIEKVHDYESLKLSTPIYDEEGNIVDYEKDGDIVTFALQVGSTHIPDTHRLISREYNEEEGKYYFQTLGDNPDLHSKGNLKPDKPWSEELLIGKVIYHSEGFGTFLTIASPDSAASAGKKAWFFPAAIVSPIVILAIYYIADAFIKYYKEEKALNARIDEALKNSGIDLNDEEAVELFRMKEELRIEYQEEKEKIKAKIRKQMEKEKNGKK